MSHRWHGRKQTLARCAGVILVTGVFTVPVAVGAQAVPARQQVTGAVTHLVMGTATPPNTRAACPWPPASGHAACLVLIRTDIASQPDPLTSSPAGYGPDELRDAYNLTQASAQDGSAETVAVVDAYDDPRADLDLAVYRAHYGLPPCTTANGCFRKVNQSGKQGNYPPADPFWAVEESLDVDMVSAICPRCHILLVEANSAAFFPPDLPASVNEAVALGAKFVSNSYGGPEGSSETSLDHYYDHPGVAVTVSSGDGGYGVAWPAASRFVTAVGGTSLLPAQNSRGWAEIAWSFGGSGCSFYEAKPAWQQDGGCANRTVADVSADSDPDAGGVAIFDKAFGGWLEVGGTSVASPLIASVYALAGTPRAGTYPASYPYTNSGQLFDIVAGTNSFTGCSPASYLCTAEPGYDGPTGLGTPDGPGAFG
jgi:subtilase family serine protease